MHALHLLECCTWIEAQRTPTHLYFCYYTRSAARDHVGASAYWEARFAKPVARRHVRAFGDTCACAARQLLGQLLQTEVDDQPFPQPLAALEQLARQRGHTGSTRYAPTLIFRHSPQPANSGPGPTIWAARLVAAQQEWQCSGDSLEAAAWQLLEQARQHANGASNGLAS